MLKGISLANVNLMSYLHEKQVVHTTRHSESFKNFVHYHYDIETVNHRRTLNFPCAL